VKIYITSVFVDDQLKAERFYCDLLGFKVKNDISLGEFRWLTVSQSVAEGEVQLLLEPSAHPAVAPYRDAMMADGIPLASFLVDDLDAEHDRLTDAGVASTQKVRDLGDHKSAVFNDTCGNLIQLVQMK